MPTLYGSSIADATLTTACDMATTTGGSETSKTTVSTFVSGGVYVEITSQGSAGLACVTAIPATPTGRGWVYKPGAGTFANANWSAAATLSAVNWGGSSANTDVTIRFSKYSSGTYTVIGSINVGITSLSKTTYTFSATSMPSTTFGVNDLLHVEMWWHDTNSNASGDNPTVYESTSATQGVANDVQVATSAFTPSSVTKTLRTRVVMRTQVTKTLQSRFRLRVQQTKTLAFRFVLQKVSTTKSLVFRFVERTQVTKTLAFRVLMKTQRTLTLPFRLVMVKAVKTLLYRIVIRITNTKTLQFRTRVRTQGTNTLAFRVRLAGPRLLNGGFTLFANGTGTAQFDHFRVTEYPDPALSLAPILPRVGATAINWNPITPGGTTLGTDVSTDGVNWTDVSSGNGGSLPGIFSQPDPTIDGFDANTSSNHTNTFRTGGSAATVTYDTANSRLALTGGTNGIYIYNAISRADIDFFADLDQSDAGGLVWRYIDQSNFYYLLIGDSLASTGSKNTVTLFKVASNVQTQLATAAISYTIGPNTVTFTRGTYRRFRVNMQSGVITVYVDGMSLISYTDGSPLAAGKMGLYNNGGATGSRYYQLWLQPLGDYVSGTPAGDIVTSTFVYTRQRLSSTDPTATPQDQDVTTVAFTPDIGAGVVIPASSYNKEFVAKNYDDLAKQSNYSWYINPAKKLIFRSSQTVAAPWILQSAPAGLVASVDLEVSSDLELDVSNDLYRNRQTVKGAIDTVTASASFTGDGNTRSFTLGYPLAATPTVILNGATQTVGAKGSSGYQWYYAVGDAVIEQDSSGTILQSTDQLSVPNYTGQFVVDVVVNNVVEQQLRAAIEGGTGIVEDVQDFTGKGLSADAATTLANQLITRYAVTGRTFTFDTSRDGLEVGQILSIFLPEHGIWDGQFEIHQIDITMQKGVNDTQIWWYKVTVSELPKQDSWAKLIASGLNLQ